MKAGFAIAAGGVANLTIGLGILGSAFGLAGAAGNFEQQMNLIAKLANASGARLERLRTAAIEAGLATKFSPDEAVEGLKQLITAGMNAEEAMLALTPTLQVATFGMISVAEAGDAINNAMRSFYRENLTAQQAADRLATIMARTNFQARDFAVGLSAVAAQANMANQTLDTTLVSMGLLRNLNVGASRSATALREALRRLSSDQRALAEATRLVGAGGVFSEGGRGRMRNIIDIMEDLDVATRNLTAAERSRHLAIILGSKGIQMFEAVQAAKFRRTLADGTTEILRGAAAARALEEEMRNSAGMADVLQRAVSEGNYAGVVNVLQGVAQTLLVEVGRPIAEVLIPPIVILRDMLTDLTRFINKLPMPVKKFGAVIMLLSGVMFSGAGLIGLFAAALAVLIPVLDIVALTVGILALSMFPFIAATGAAIAAIIMFERAFRMNIGGIATYFGDIWRKVKLGFDALTQLFSRGELSTAIWDELNRAENQGIKQFILDIYSIGYRIKEFFHGIQIGFNFVAKGLAPRLKGMVDAFKELFRALGFTSEGARALAGTNVDKWAEAGASIGGHLADVLGYIVDGIRRVTKVATYMVGFIKTGWSEIAPYFYILRDQVDLLANELEKMFAELNVYTGDSEMTLLSFGKIAAKVFGWIADGILWAITVFVWFGREIVGAVRWMMKFKAGVLDVFNTISIYVKATFENITDIIKNSIDKLLVYIGRLVRMIPAGFRMGALDEVIRTGMDAEQRVNARNLAITRRTVEAQRAAETRGTIHTRVFEMTATEGRRARGGELDRVVEALTLERKRDREEALRPIQVVIDGEVVAQAANRANRREQARGFVPAPADAS